MSGYKRKDRASPDSIESDDDAHMSEEPRRGLGNERDTSRRRRRSISDGEGYPNDVRENSRARGGGPRPGVGGFRLHRIERRHPADYEGRLSPGYHRGPSSSRGVYQHSRSPEPYGRVREGGARWSDSRDGWPTASVGRYEEYGSGPYGDEFTDHEYDMQGTRSGRHHTQRSSPAPHASSTRALKGETSMEAPTKRPVQLDRY